MKKYLGLLILFAVLEIAGALYLTIWREHFWNAVATKSSMDFLLQLGIFTGIALVLCFLSGISGYLINLTTIKWRENLDARFRTYKVHHTIENIPQRLQEDCQRYPELVLGLGYGLCKALIYILVFSISLVMEFSGHLLFYLLLYTIVGNYLTYKIAYPLTKLNYEQQRAEATYRSTMHIDNFADCIRIMFGMAKKQKHLTYFQQFYGQVGVIIPLLLIAPTYFTTAMTIGVLMRFNSVCGTILDNMSYGIANWGSVNALLSCRKRLKEVGVI